MKTTTRTARRQPTVTHGTCRLTHSPLFSLETALDCGAAILSIRPQKGGWADYLVQREKDCYGKVTGYRLEKIVGHPEEKAPVYKIDASFGPEAGHWHCDCPSEEFDRKRLGVPCKHVRAIHEHLARAGLVPGCAVEPQKPARVVNPCCCNCGKSYEDCGCVV